MADKKEITADDLAKVAASLSIVGYSLALLAIERAEQESLGSKGKDRKQMSAAINKLYSRFNG